MTAGRCLDCGVENVKDHVGAWVIHHKEDCPNRNPKPAKRAYRRREMVTCPYCNETMTKAVHDRWHVPCPIPNTDKRSDRA